MVRAIPLDWSGFIGKCPSIFLGYLQWSLTGRFSITENTPSDMCIPRVDTQNTDALASTSKIAVQSRGSSGVGAGRINLRRVEKAPRSQLSVSFTAISRVSVQIFQLCNTQLSVKPHPYCVVHGTVAHARG